MTISIADVAAVEANVLTDPHVQEQLQQDNLVAGGLEVLQQDMECTSKKGDHKHDLEHKESTVGAPPPLALENSVSTVCELSRGITTIDLPGETGESGDNEMLSLEVAMLPHGENHVEVLDNANTGILAVLAQDDEITSSSLVIPQASEVDSPIKPIEQKAQNTTYEEESVDAPPRLPQENVCVASVGELAREITVNDLPGETRLDAPMIQPVEEHGQNNHDEEESNAGASPMLRENVCDANISKLEREITVIDLPEEIGELRDNEMHSLDAMLPHCEEKGEQPKNPTAGSLKIPPKNQNLSTKDMAVPQTSKAAASAILLTEEKEQHIQREENVCVASVCELAREITVNDLPGETRLDAPMIQPVEEHGQNNHDEEESNAGASPMLRENVCDANISKLEREITVIDLPEEIGELRDNEMHLLDAMLPHCEEKGEQPKNPTAGSLKVPPKNQNLSTKDMAVPQTSKAAASMLLTEEKEQHIHHEILSLDETLLPYGENKGELLEENTASVLPVRLQAPVSQVLEVHQSSIKAASLTPNKRKGQTTQNKPYSENKGELLEDQTLSAFAVPLKEEKVVSRYATAMPQILELARASTEAAALIPSKRKTQMIDRKDLKRADNFEESKVDVAPCNQQRTYGGDLKRMILSQPIPHQMKLVEEVLETMPQDKVKEIFENLRAKEFDVESQTRKRTEKSPERKGMIWSLVASTVSSLASHAFLFLLAWKFGEERRWSFKEIRGTSKQWLKWAVNKLIAPVLLCSMLVASRVYIIEPEERVNPQQVYRHNQLGNLLVNSLSKVVFFAIKEIPGAELVALLIAHVTSIIIDMCGAFLLWWKEGYHDPDVADN